MGRWAQQRRRGGGPGAAAFLVPNVIVSVIESAPGSGTYRWQFDTEIVVTGLSADFEIDGEAPGGLGPVGLNYLDLNYSIATGALPWSLAVDPAPDVSSAPGTTIPIPQSGTTA